ncbi:tail protein X [Megamonas hypermegale]|uniref:tail protein X n=1 Tax=Megamonas hypermegale TaxID=158847 RepID=UPI0025A46CA4|nr:tail protein X [Megamonas hypermegale]MDM8143152.1 tail protein X [Megamonas hypermegale]
MTYKTISGDTWDLIAYKILGSEVYMEELLNANQEYKDFIVFPANINLIVPEITVPTVSTLPPWRR